MMITKKINWLVALGMVFTLKSGFGDELFQYTLQSFPKKTGFTCAGTAKEIAGKFTAVTGKTVFRSYCNADTAKGFNISIVYRAENAVSYMATQRELEGRGDFGSYSTEEECQKNLNQEIRWFELGTGLNHFVAYCLKESNQNQTPYAAFVDGFGSAQLFPYRFQKNIYGQVIGAASPIMNELSALTLAANIKVNAAIFAHDGIYKLVVRYYDIPENDIFRSDYFKVEELAQFNSYNSKETQSNCLYSSQETLREFLPEFTERSVKFCVWDPMLFRATLYLVRVKPVIDFKNETPPLHFSSFKDCEAERKMIVNYYQTELKKDVVGGLCSWESRFGTGLPDSFRVRVFIREKK